MNLCHGWTVAVSITRGGVCQVQPRAQNHRGRSNLRSSVTLWYRLHIQSRSGNLAWMPAYYRRPWNETPGGAYDAWGASTWYFEVDDDGSVLRQVEKYDHGPTLGYGPDLEQDEWGFLTFDPIDVAEFEPYLTDAQDFDAAWAEVTRPQGPST